MSTQALKAVATGATSDPFAQLLSRPMRSFDPDAYHVMQERDNQLIRDNLLHGAANKEFVYQFSIKGTNVTGISVVGARQLASEYKGIKSRIVASTEKRGALFIFRTFEPLDIKTVELPALSDDPDFYEVVMEVQDVKTGNSIQVRKSESRLEQKRDGSLFARPHYDVIAESKAFRNGVLSVLPQSVIIEFEKRCLAAGNRSDELTIDQLRDRTTAYCAKNGINLIRGALTALNYAELRGLASSAGTSIDAFRQAAESLGIVPVVGGIAVDPGTGEILAGQDDALREVEQKGAVSRRGSKKQDPEETLGQKIRRQLENAQDADVLAVAADLISELADQAEVDELTALYNKRRAELDA